MTTRIYDVCYRHKNGRTPAFIDKVESVVAYDAKDAALQAEIKYSGIYSQFRIVSVEPHQAKKVDTAYGKGVDDGQALCGSVILPD